MSIIEETSLIFRRVYGRRQTRSLSPTRQDQFETLLETVKVAPDKIKAGHLKTADIFKGDFNALWLEIGFGNGEHLKLEMAAHPDRAYIGAEPFINGMAAFLKSVADMPLDNVRVHMDDAMQIVDALADSTLDGIFILNPDPWPKKRHWKRRIVQAEHITKFVRVLKPGGKLIMTTDIDDLAEWMNTHASNNTDLRWTAEKPDDWKTPPDGWVATKYERKGAAKGRQQTYLIYECVKKSA